MKKSEIVKLALERFQLDRDGIHGVAHWSRVSYHGEVLREIEGGDLEVIRMFSFFHDCCRESDGHDVLHGDRAGEYVKSLYDSGKIRLTDSQMEVLLLAMRGHTGEIYHSDKTVQCCWDADRLDLGRVGIQPDPFYLNTDTAKVMIANSVYWSLFRKRVDRNLRIDGYSERV